MSLPLKMLAIASTVLPWLLLAMVADLSSAMAATDEWCLERGFDSSNLSCDTCILLDEAPSLQRRRKPGSFDPSIECRSCCRSHKSNPVLRPAGGSALWSRGKYRYAVLAHGGEAVLKSAYEEISDFIERDAEDVRSFKGDRRFTIADSGRRGGGDIGGGARVVMTEAGLQFVGRDSGAPRLLLFEKIKVGGEAWTDEDENEAGEIIELRGWKREDLKDMLMTLLPNA